MAYTFGTVVSLEFRQNLENRYPAVFADNLKVKFLYFILFSDLGRYGEFSLSDGENIPLYHEYVRGVILGVKDTSFSVGQFLADFQDAVDFPLNLTSHSRFTGQARTFDPSLPADLESLLVAELKVPRRRKVKPVYFYDGKTYADRKTSQYRKQMHAQHYCDNQQSVITRYFGTLNPVSYNRYYQNIDDLVEMVASGDYTEQEQKSYLMHLNALSDSLVPRYFENNPYERVWAQGLSLQNLKKEFRSSVLRGCIEADLVSCHLTIAAYDWNIPSLKTLLEQGVNIWKYIHNELGLPFGESTKAEFKKGVYAIIYGGGESKIRQEMDVPQPVQDAFLALPLIREFMAVAKQQRDKATREKQIALADGSILKSRRGTKTRRAIKPYQLISWRAISIERYLIESVFRVAERFPDDFRILSLEHDGFTFVMLDSSKEKLVWDRLSKAVASAGKELGIRISLESK